MTLPRLGLLVGLLCASLPLSGQRVHTVALQNPSPGVFRFAPDRLSLGGSDVLEFTVESGGPYVIGFLAGDFRPEEVGRLQAALPGGGARLRGPVLEGQGASFRVILPGLRAGTYRFESVTHASYRMQGAFTVR